MREKIFEWYQIHKRNFPWRYTRDPYKIMIAEFMLHRTRAEQVAPFYVKFIEKYPDVNSLRDADEKEIKKITEHLGLHWRTNHFIRAAKFIINNYDGTFPEDREELLKIPGVGDYVAGAILTVCFSKSEYVVDSNIARFINRFYNLKLKGEIRRKREIIDISTKLFQCDNPREFLFALIDFTSIVCRPKSPLCKTCPLKINCGYCINDF